MTATHPDAATRNGAVAATAAVVMWGAGNVIVKQIGMTGIAIAFWRLWLGVVVFGALHLARGGRITWRTLRDAAPGGLAFTLDVALFFEAIKHTSVADASIISALQPALVFVVAGRLFGEHVTWVKVAWSGVAIVATVGAVLLSAAGAGRTPGGDLLAVLSLFAWAWYFVASKQCRQKLAALEYQAALTIVAAAALTPFALVSPHALIPNHLTTFWWIPVMVLVPGMGHLLVNWAHRHAPITLVSLLTLGIPVVATIGAAVALDEPVSAGQWICMGVVLVALAFVLQSDTRVATDAARTGTG